MHNSRRLPALSVVTIALGLGLLGAGPVTAQSESPSASPAPLTQLWTASGPAASKPSTWQPAIDPATGDIWVAADWDNTFWIFGSDGTYRESWGTTGSGPGEFNFLTTDIHPVPFGWVAFAPNGSFYVMDTGNNRVQAFDKDRNFVTQWGAFGSDDGQFVRAWSIATDGTTVYVGDDTRMDIQAFDTNGTYLHTIDMSSVWNEAVPTGFFTLDPTGRIVTTGNSTDPGAPGDIGVTVLDPVSGQQVAHYPVSVPGFYLGLAVDAAGNTFVNVVDPAIDTHYIALVEMDPTGTTLGTWSTAGQSIAVAPDDSAIYLAGEQWPDLRAYTLPKP